METMRGAASASPSIRSGLRAVLVFATRVPTQLAIDACLIGANAVVALRRDVGSRKGEGASGRRRAIPQFAIQPFGEAVWLSDILPRPIKTPRPMIARRKQDSRRRGSVAIIRRG